MKKKTKRRDHSSSGRNRVLDVLDVLDVRDVSIL